MRPGLVSEYKDVRQYGDLLIDVIVGELPDILSNEYDLDGQYRANSCRFTKTW